MWLTSSAATNQSLSDLLPIVVRSKRSLQSDQRALQNGFGLLILYKSDNRQILGVDLVLLFAKGERVTAMACLLVFIEVFLCFSADGIDVESPVKALAVFGSYRETTIVRAGYTAHDHRMEADSVFPGVSNLLLGQNYMEF